MQIVVQKFGGTSVATSELRAKVVQKICHAREQGMAPVVVVSAMGRKGAPYATDTLISLGREGYHDIAARELDMLMCTGEMISAAVLAATLQGQGVPAVVLTGGQAGIITDSNFNNARILKVDPRRLLTLLKNGQIPVVCGFQGITADGEFTTLGRGGSDTTAAALGVALDACVVEIYTDVEGIMTADPRIVPNAQILDCISYNEVCQLAQQGAKVIHPRAVEIAMQKNIKLVVKSTFSDAPGTVITNINKENTNGVSLADRVATGVTYLDGVCQINVWPDGQAGYDSSVQVFKAMADAGISVDLINVLPEKIMFTVNQDVQEKAVARLRELGFKVNVVPDCAKVSVVGGGMREVPGVMATFVEALTARHIPILQTVDSHTSISALVAREHMSAAVKALHEKFGLANGGGMGTCGISAES